LKALKIDPHFDVDAAGSKQIAALQFEIIHLALAKVILIGSIFVAVLILLWLLLLLLLLSHLILIHNVLLLERPRLLRSLRDASNVCIASSNHFILSDKELIVILMVLNASILSIPPIFDGFDVLLHVFLIHRVVIVFF
jgi:hypothetical protein